MRPEKDAPPSRRTVLLVVGLFVALLIANVWILNSDYAVGILYAEWLPLISGPSEQHVGKHIWRKSRDPGSARTVQDEHPIRALMDDANLRFRTYDKGRSRTFKETAEKYRRKYGRHPPPGFKQWYKFARERNVHNIDDFDQINDDLRPFWAIPPAEIRHYAAHASDDRQHLVATVSVRDGQVFQELWGWRSETFVRMLSTIAQWLPDMDVPVNRMDQPRVVVPWEEMQGMLRVEEGSRSLGEEGVEDRFTKNMSGFWQPRPLALDSMGWLSYWNPFWYPTEHVEDPANPHPEYGWFWHAGQQYMDLAAKACPPVSCARNLDSTEHRDAAEASYKVNPKLEQGGFIINFNLSSDLCTVGPQLADKHGMLFASQSMLATHKLVPIFGESKVNVNNDILFPANMYWKHDKRYEYNDEQDISWDEKDDTMPWRGVTSGGTAFADKPEQWQQMHRQRLVSLTNATALSNSNTSTTTLALSDPIHGTYIPHSFHPASFAAEHTDVGFTEITACIPDCGFYNASLTMLNQTTFAQTFASKYLIDVDGHSFSGRWRAFLQSRSLGMKATIFREWHDSRLFAWRHFVPVDNRFDDLYSLLTYFIGLTSSASRKTNAANDVNDDNYDPVAGVETGRELVVVPRHDHEAHTLAHQGREWAAKVLRREDMQIYLFRLLLEYGRVIDDERERLGVVGDGGREMEGV